MIKIGLLNIQNVDNYGANLIAFSMEQEILRLGIPEAEVETINFCPDLRTTSRQADSFKNQYRQFGLPGIARKSKTVPFYVKRFIKSKIRQTRLFLYIRKLIRRDTIFFDSDGQNEEQEKRLFNFDSFRRDYLHLSEKKTSAEVEELPYDIIIVGSDVVWKPARLLAEEENRAYFLLHNKKCKKIAYAASIGMADTLVLSRLKRKYAEAVNRFDYISVREKAAQVYLQSLLPKRDIINCIDPVFLRKREEYLNLIREMGSAEGRYIYVYVMGNNEESYRYARRLAEKKKLPIICHTNCGAAGLHGKSSKGDGPKEFLHRVYHADYVVTDTFHGTAFSIIFRKKFITFTRGNMSVRLEDFLSRMGLMDRFVEAAEEIDIIERQIDYDKIEAKIDDWAAFSAKWLEDAVEDSIKNLHRHYISAC